MTEHRCPECGGEFNPDDPSTFLAAATDVAKLRRTNRVVVIVLIGHGSIMAISFVGTSSIWGFRFLQDMLPVFGPVLALLVVFYGFNCWQIRKLEQ